MNLAAFRKILTAVRANHGNEAADILRVLDAEVEHYIHHGATEQFRLWVNCTINTLTDGQGRIAINHDRLSVLAFIVTGKPTLGVA